MQKEIVESVLKLEKMAFEEITYSRDINSREKSIDYEMNFSRSITACEESEKYKVSLTANVWSKNTETIKLIVTLTGIFSCECEDESLKNELLRYNTVAILFPYVRSQISLVSTQPGIAPISFPPVNIVAMFKEVDQRGEPN